MTDPVELILEEAQDHENGAETYLLNMIQAQLMKKPNQAPTTSQAALRRLYTEEAEPFQ